MWQQPRRCLLLDIYEKEKEYRKKEMHVSELKLMTCISLSIIYHKIAKKSRLVLLLQQRYNGQTHRIKAVLGDV